MKRFAKFLLVWVFLFIVFPFAFTAYTKLLEPSSLTEEQVLESGILFRRYFTTPYYSVVFSGGFIYVTISMYSRYKKTHDRT